MRPVLYVVLLAPLAGCGKTTREAITELQPVYADVRVKLKRLAGVAAGEVPQNQRLDGAVYDREHDDQTTLSMLTYERLVEPDVEIRSGDAAYIKTFDPVAGGIFAHCLAWTGPSNPMSASVMGQHDGEAFLKKCDPKRLRTLVVVRTVASVVPELVADGKFEGGRATIEVTAIDWASEKALARFTIEGVPDQVVQVRLRPGESKAVEAAVAVHSSMWSDARKKLFAALRDRGAVIAKD